MKRLAKGTWNIPRKKMSFGESLAESHAYDPIRDSWQDSWRDSGAKSLAKSLGSNSMHDSQRDSLRDSFFFYAGYETYYLSGPIWYFKVEIILFKTPLDCFDFIDLEPRYCTSNISHPFNFEIPAFTVFSRGIEGSRKQVYRLRARVCWCVWVWVCERAVHADLKVEAGLKLKVMVEHTCMLDTHAEHACRTRMRAHHSRTPHIYHARHARKPRLACIT